MSEKPPKKPQGPIKFVRDTRPVSGYTDKQSKTWVTIVLVGIIAFCVIMFDLGGWSVLAAHIPYGNSDYFWVGLIFLPMLVLIIGAGIAKWIEFRRAASWSQTTAKILRTEIKIERHRFGNDPETVKNVPFVEYQFTAGGRDILGTRISIDEGIGGANTEATLKRYPVGATVPVFYDVDDPRSCVLERTVREPMPVAGCAAALAMLAGFIAAVYLLITKGPAFFRSIFPKADNVEFAIAAMCFGLFVLMFFFAIRKGMKQSAKWPTVRGQVVKSGTEQFSDTDSDGKSRTMHRPVVEYTYQVHGHAYHGTQIQLMTEVSGSENYAQKKAGKYPAGSSVTVLYDPANPGTAALENSTGMTWIMLAAALGCFGLAAWQLGVFK
jgi:hypothetical protein